MNKTLYLKNYREQQLLNYKQQTPEQLKAFFGHNYASDYQQQKWLIQSNPKQDAEL